MKKAERPCVMEEPSHLPEVEGECSHPLLYRQELPTLVSELVESCQDQKTFHHLNLAGLPSREAALEIIDGLRKVLFPGYFGPREMDAITLS